MSDTDPNAPILQARDLRKRFPRETGEIVHALDGVSLVVNRGSLTALVGPDSAGKTTLLRLAAGLMAPDSGELDVLGLNVAAAPQQVQSQVAYMPQRFGLYEDLTVQENLDLYATLRGVTAQERKIQYPRLMSMAALGPFTSRLAGRLSGGMKQKLGLACTLLGSPELILLDEPTAGVDPLSRRELWDIILQLVKEGLTVLVSTSYLDEADRCEHVIVMHQGRVLKEGAPADVTRMADGHTFFASPPEGHKARELQAKLLDDPDVIDAVPEGGQVRIVRQSAHQADGLPPATPTPSRFEDGFMMLLRKTAQAEHRAPAAMAMEQPAQPRGEETAVQVHNLVRQFGSFLAVDHVSFEVRRGEIFGLLGPNGAGKTTTFRMLCGLLPASGGTLQVAGVDVRHARASARSASATSRRSSLSTAN